VVLQRRYRPKCQRDSVRVDFYNQLLPYADSGEATVLGHLRRALEFTWKRTGKHGLPCGLAADWNDCLKLGYYGEKPVRGLPSAHGLSVYTEIANGWASQKKLPGPWRNPKASRKASRRAHGWRLVHLGHHRDSTVYARTNMRKAKVYLNTQLWAVISGAATPEEAARCMQTVALTGWPPRMG